MCWVAVGCSAGLSYWVVTCVGGRCRCWQIAPPTALWRWVNWFEVFLIFPSCVVRYVGIVLSICGSFFCLAFALVEILCCFVRVIVYLGKVSSAIVSVSTRRPSPVFCCGEEWQLIFRVSFVEFVCFFAEGWAISAPTCMLARFAGYAPFRVWVWACCHSVGFSAVAACVFRFRTVPSHVVPSLAFEASNRFLLDFFDVALFPADCYSVGY